MIIRRIQKEEWELFRETRLRALKDSPRAFASTYAKTSLRSDKSWIKQVFDSSLGPKRCTILAMDQDQVLGLAALYEMPGKSDNSGELLQVWVPPESRGRGVGRALIYHLHEWGFANGYVHIFATVHRENPEAIAFYMRIGYITDLVETERTPPRDHVLRYDLNG